MVWNCKPKGECKPENTVPSDRAAAEQVFWWYSQRFHCIRIHRTLHLSVMLKQETKNFFLSQETYNPAQRNRGVGDRTIGNRAYKSCKRCWKVILSMFVSSRRIGRTTQRSKWWCYGVMCCRLTLEEFDPTWHYIKGEKDVVADTLYHLAILPTATDDETQLWKRLWRLDQLSSFIDPWYYLKLVESNKVLRILVWNQDQIIT